jgi:hypothetical protein
MEHEFKQQGLWDEYKKNIINSDLDGLIEMYKNFMLEQININNDSFITERGKKENWVGKGNIERIKQTMEEGIEYLKSFKKL